MKILLMNQFFWPDSAATSQLLTDLARQLVADGHEIQVVCSGGGYAPPATDEAPRVDVFRVATIPFRRRKVGRVLSYASFYIGAAWKGLTLPRADIVITLTTPPLLSLIGTAIKFLRGSRHVIWEMDVYPDVAVTLGYFKEGGILDRSVGALADWSRRNADTIVALGACMKQRLVRRGIPPEKIQIADNWADSHTIAVLPKAGNHAKLVLLYSGNLGLAHDIDTVLGAIRQLRTDTRFKFIFVGNGSRRRELAHVAKAESITTLELRPHVERASLGECLAVGDIGLVTQKNECCGAVVPSKVYGLLAAGRPVLFIGPADATPALIIRRFNCGWHIPCGASEELVRLLLHLADNPREIQAAGARAREALLEHFDLSIGTARVSALIYGISSNLPAELIAFSGESF